MTNAENRSVYIIAVGIARHLIVILKTIMALRELTEGECGARNPVLKVASHFTQDKGFRQDVAHVHRPVDARPEDVMVREFLEGIPPPSRTRAGAFNMNNLMQDLRDLERPDISNRPPIQPGPNVAEYAFREKNWVDEFLRNEPHVIPAEVPMASNWSQEFVDQPGYVGATFQPPADWDTHWNNLTSHLDPNQQGAMSLHHQSELAKTASHVVDNMKDPKFAQSEFMKKISSGDDVLTQSTAKTVDNALSNSNWASEFLGAEGVTKEPGPNADLDWTKEFMADKPAEPSEDWAREFMSGASAEVYRSEPQSQSDFWSQLQQDWDKAAEENPSNFSWLKETPQDPLNEYAFEQENPYRDQTDPYNAGIKKRQDGDLPSAILLFEAAVQKDPEHAKAWEVLGQSLAENEQDPGAIAAYKQCLALEPTNLVAIMGLAVSYTNESYQLQACRALEDWIKNNPKYAHLVSVPITRTKDDDRFFTSLVSGDTFNGVQDLYMQAARLQPSGDLDPDVQTGLGVLLNLSGDFDKAPDCFRAALQMRPNDSLLWNRLGATLANGGRSEEAVQAYYKALEISPGFIRARYNLAVSCINLGAHREAAEHLVSALLLQGRRSKRVMSDNIWSTLRMVMNLMNRREFIPDIDAKDLSRLATEFGINE